MTNTKMILILSSEKPQQYIPSLLPDYENFPSGGILGSAQNPAVASAYSTRTSSIAPARIATFFILHGRDLRDTIMPPIPQ